MIYQTNPLSTAYPDCHPEFSEPIDLWWHIVKRHGELTPVKLKEKIANESKVDHHDQIK